MRRDGLYWFWAIFLSGIASFMSPILGVGLFILCVAAKRNEKNEYEKYLVERATELQTKYKEMLDEIDKTFVPERFTCTKAEWKVSMAKIKLRNTGYPQADELNALREADEVVWRSVLDDFGYEYDEVYNVYFTMKPTGTVWLKQSCTSGYEVFIPSTNDKSDNGGTIVVVMAEDIPSEIEKFRRENQHDGRV